MIRGPGTYVGAFGDDINSRRSGVNSTKRKACCGELCVKRILRAACVDIFSHALLLFIYDELVKFWQYFFQGKTEEND